MGALRLATPLNLAASIACSTGAVVAEGTQTIIGEDIKPRPGSMRSLLLAMEGSVHGRIRDILGSDEAERVETIVRFLEGATDEEMSELLGLVQIANTEVHRTR